MGLLLGASVMTVCELLDLIFYNCARKLHSRMRTTHASANSKPNDMTLYDYGSE